jgi:hypothetical protein
MWPKCNKCGGGHKVENYGIRCSFYNGLRHSKDQHWKNKEIKPPNSSTNYLEVLVNDEKATLIELIIMVIMLIAILLTKKNCNCVLTKVVSILSNFT